MGTQIIPTLVATLFLAVVWTGNCVAESNQPSIAELLAGTGTPKQSAAPAAGKPKAYIFEISQVNSSNKGYVKVEKISQPNRVYLKRTAVDKDLQHFLTDYDGKLSDVERILLAGTVVRGDRIGGAKKDFYVLAADGKWRTTSGPEVYNVQDDTESRDEYVVLPANEPGTLKSRITSRGSIPSH